MKTNTCLTFLLLLSIQQNLLAQNQNIGLGTTSPHASAQLDVSSTSKGVLLPRMTAADRMAIASPAAGLIVYQTDFPRNFYVYDGTQWQQLTNATDIPTYSGWTTTGGGSFSTSTSRSVGIGIVTPSYSLHVNGSVKGGNGYFNSIGVGTTFTGGTGLHVVSSDVYLNDGTFRLSGAGVEKGFLHLSGDNVRIGTVSSNNTGSFVIRTDGADRVTVDNAGNMGVTGDITTGGKGVLYNAANANNLRYYTRTAQFDVVNLAPHGITAEGAIGFSGFTTAPQVIVGDIVTTGGTTGPLYKLQLVIYDVTATGCKCRISNTSNATINQNITWNIICVGR